jgi:hypothetical protein
MQGSILSISAMTSTPASRSARRWGRRRAFPVRLQTVVTSDHRRYLTGVELPELTERVMTVNWLMIEIRNPAGAVT